MVRKSAELYGLVVDTDFLRGKIMVNVKEVVIAVTVLFAGLMFTGCNNSVTQFQQAVELGNLDEAQALLVEEPNLVNAEKEGQTLLCEAVQKYQRQIVLFLLQNGADVNAKDKRGFTPLHYAAEKGYVQIAELLIDRGANVNAKDTNDETPLHIAALCGHKDIILALLAAEAVVNAENSMARTPLHYAAREGHSDEVKVLLAHGATVNAKDRSPGLTALHYAAYRNQKDVVALLLDAGADVNSRDLLAYTPLYWASSIARPREGETYEYTIEVLREHGAHM
jgi:ankyrin repeat protein